MDIGEQLRHAREARGLSIDALSKAIRVQPRILSAIEQNDCATIPPRPYGRGFVRTFAVEVGLDPESTVREFFSQFAGVNRAQASLHPRILDIPYRPDHGRWLRPLGAILGYAAIAAVVIAGGRWIIGKNSEPAAVTTAVGTGGANVPISAPAIERTPAPVPPRPASGVNIALEAVRPAWVTAVVDGQRTVYRTLQPGERVALNGIRDVSIRTGDAGALNWQVNGRTVGPMGQSGEVRTVRVTLDTAGTVK
jgi:transcriptional regulator with XRE-family HTH domain